MGASSLIDSRVGISFIQITPRIFFFLVFFGFWFHSVSWFQSKRCVSFSQKATQSSSWFLHCTMNLHYRRKPLCMVGCFCKMKNTGFDFFPLFLFVGRVFYIWLCSKSRNALYNQMQAHAQKSDKQEDSHSLKKPTYLCTTVQGRLEFTEYA